MCWLTSLPSWKEEGVKSGEGQERSQKEEENKVYQKVSKSAANILELVTYNNSRSYIRLSVSNIGGLLKVDDK